MKSGGSATEKVNEATEDARSWLLGFARFGYAAKGAVYVTIGLVAMGAAFNLGGEAEGSRGALLAILDKPFGRVLLGVVGAGLVGHALWRLLEAVVDVERQGWNLRGTLKRLGYLFSALAYGGLALTAFQMLAGWRVGSARSSLEFWTGFLLSQPLGRWLVGLSAVPFVGLALNAVYVAWRAMFREKLELAKMNPTEVKWATLLGRLGLLARGVVLGVVGVFLVRAALFAEAGAAAGVEQALHILAGLWPGPWLLGGVGLGLLAYGLYAMVEARYRQMSLGV